MKEQPIKLDMTIGNVVDEHPETAEVFLGFGLHCVGCAVNPYETIEQGAMGHGMERETIDSLLSELNMVVTKEAPFETNPEGITLSPNAMDALEAIAETEGEGSVGLRIQATKTENGLDYFLDLVQAPEESEKTLEWKGWKIFIDENSLELMKPSIIDYVKMPSGEGFKIIAMGEERCPCDKPMSECSCKGKAEGGCCGGNCGC